MVNSYNCASSRRPNPTLWRTVPPTANREHDFESSIRLISPWFHHDFSRRSQGRRGVFVSWSAALLRARDFPCSLLSLSFSTASTPIGSARLTHELQQPVRGCVQGMYRFKPINPARLIGAPAVRLHLISKQKPCAFARLAYAAASDRKHYCDQVRVAPAELTSTCSRV